MPTPAVCFDYKGPTSWAQTGEVNVPGCIKPTSADGDADGHARNLYSDCSTTTAMWSAPRSVSA